MSGLLMGYSFYKNTFIKDVFHVVLTFMYLFAFHFKDGAGVHSGMAVFAYLLIFTALHKDFFRQLVGCCFTKYVLRIITVFLVTCLWICICLLLNGTWDLSFVKTFLHMFFQFGVGIFLFQYLKYQECEEKTLTYAIIAFFVQTCIQWLAFLVPSVRTILNFTKSQQTIRIGMSYGGTRAVALSGSDFFGLSAAYAIALLVYWSRYNSLFKNNRIIKFAAYCFLMTGTFFAGRTGFIGVAFAGLYGICLLIKKKLAGEKISFQLNDQEKPIAIIAGLAACVVLVIVIILFFTNEDIYNLLSFALQPIFSLFTEGTLEITSVSKMFDMYFAVPIKTLLIGDGMYTAAEGRYYMNTDVGYMRVVLYMGVIGFVLMLLLQLSIMRIRKGEESLLKFVTLLCLLVLNIKGEVIAWSLIVQGCVILFCLQNNVISRKR